MSIIFNPATLEIDAALWGSFWQGDVVSVGYTLPALELAFLRENRLTHTTDATSPAEYLAQLQNSLNQTPIGIWEATISGHTLRCIAVPASSQWRIIWHTPNTLFAGYTSPPIASPGYNLRNIKRPTVDKYPSPSKDLQSFARQILDALPQWHDDWHTLSANARIDRIIQTHRAYSLLPMAKKDIAIWLDAFVR